MDAVYSNNHQQPEVEFSQREASVFIVSSTTEVASKVAGAASIAASLEEATDTDGGKDDKTMAGSLSPRQSPCSPSLLTRDDDDDELFIAKSTFQPPKKDPTGAYAHGKL